jgi:hypothetical protein
MIKLLKKILPIADKLLLGGIFQKKNQDLEGSPSGDFHKATVIKGLIRLALILVSGYLLLLLGQGKITVEDVNAIIDSLGEI